MWDILFNANIDCLLLLIFFRCCPIRPIRMILERLDNLEAQRIKTTVESEPSEIKLDENAYISTLNVQIDDTAEKSMFNSQ